MDDLIVDILGYLEAGNTNALISTIETIKTSPQLQDIAQLVTIITHNLNGDVENSNLQLFKRCEELLNTVADNSDPEELLLQLIQEIENAKDDVTFFSILKPLQKVLVKIPIHRINSFSWGLNAIAYYFNEISLPEDLYLDEEDQVLMDTDPLVQKISHLYADLLPFYDPLILYANNLGTEVNEHRDVLTKFLIELLGKPLAYLDLGFQKSKSRGRCVAETIIAKIIKLSPNIYHILETIQSRGNSLITPKELAVAVMFYLVLTEQVCIESVPKVYEPVYVFQGTLCFVSEMLKQENQFLTQQGLQLLHTLLNNVTGRHLSYQLLDSEEHSAFCKCISNVMVYNQIETNRKFALNMFHKYLYSFDTRGRYLLIYNLMNVLHHPGLMGYITTQYKEMLVQEFKKNDMISKYFTGEKLFSLLNLFCHLHKGEQSDLIELADQIIASLNLLRYLIIRDKGNVTKVWDYLRILKPNYLEPLKRGITLSKAHYELKIKDLKSEQAKGDTKVDNSTVSVTVAGQKMPELPINEQLKVLYSSMTAFDVVESLLSRLNEFVESGLINL